MAAPVVHLYLTGDFFVKYRADKTGPKMPA
ncbi:hypothetical protein [Klebsiella pneumoniae]